MTCSVGETYEQYLEHLEQARYIISLVPFVYQCTSDSTHSVCEREVDRQTDRDRKAERAGNGRYTEEKGAFGCRLSCVELHYRTSQSIIFLFFLLQRFSEVSLMYIFYYRFVHACILVRALICSCVRSLRAVINTSLAYAHVLRYIHILPLSQKLG